jgi:hypothetical protein
MHAHHTHARGLVGFAPIPLLESSKLDRRRRGVRGSRETAMFVRLCFLSP